MSSISSDCLKKNLRTFFATKLKCHEVNISIENCSKNIDNYGGILYRATGKIDNKRSNESDQLKIIVKIAPTNEKTRVMFYLHPLFLREIFIYDEVGL